MAHLTATSQRHLPEFGATSARITALAKLERRLKELIAKHKYLDKVGWVGEQALRINQEMGTLRDRISGLLRQERRNKGAGKGSGCRRKIGRIGGTPWRGSGCM